MPLRRAPLAMVLATFLAAGCQWSEDRDLDRRVAPSELSGRWYMLESSVDDLESLDILLAHDRAEHWIEVRPGGDCHFHTILAEDYGARRTSPAILNTGCRWTLNSYEDRQDFRIELQDLRGTTQTYELFEKPGERAQLVLWQYIADPDRWKYLEYGKEWGE